MTSVSVGLVGAGPWATALHAPMLAAGPGTKLAGVWSRRLDAAQELGGRFGVPAFATYDELLRHCDAVAFCVPPEIQAQLGAIAAAHGKALLLEKPLANNVDAAQRLCEAIERHSVGSQMVLTWRYMPGADSFVAQCQASNPVAGTAEFLLGSGLGGPFATPWRLREGPVPDLGPHLLDILWAALGPIVQVDAQGSRSSLVSMLLDHETGAVSTAAVSIRLPLEPMVAQAAVFSAQGTVTFRPTMPMGASVASRIAQEFAQTARGARHPLDAHHGLALQRVLDRVQTLV